MKPPIPYSKKYFLVDDIELQEIPVGKDGLRRVVRLYSGDVYYEAGLLPNEYTFLEELRNALENDVDIDDYPYDETHEMLMEVLEKTKYIMDRYLIRFGDDSFPQHFIRIKHMSKDMYEDIDDGMRVTTLGYCFYFGIPVCIHKHVLLAPGNEQVNNTYSVATGPQTLEEFDATLAYMLNTETFDRLAYLAVLEQRNDIVKQEDEQCSDQLMLCIDDYHADLLKGYTIAYASEYTELKQQFLQKKNMSYVDTRYLIYFANIFRDSELLEKILPR